MSHAPSLLFSEHWGCSSSPMAKTTVFKSSYLTPHLTFSLSLSCSTAHCSLSLDICQVPQPLHTVCVYFWPRSPRLVWPSVSLFSSEGGTFLDSSHVRDRRDLMGKNQDSEASPRGSPSKNIIPNHKAGKTVPQTHLSKGRGWRRRP